MQLASVFFELLSKIDDIGNQLVAAENSPAL